MNCNDAIELLTESLAAPLAGRAAADLAAHLAACDACRAEAADMRRIWKELARLPDEIPGEEMRQRFAASLDLYLAPTRGRGLTGFLGGPRRFLGRLGAGLEGWLAGWLPRRPLAQAGLAAATLAVGLLIGSVHGFGLPRGGTRTADSASGANGAHGANAADGADSASGAPSANGVRSGASADAADPQRGEIHALRDEVRSLSRLVTLSLLKQDSASERLRGVSFGREAGAGDDRVLQALLDTLRHDPDVNVRLAAVDALAPALEQPAVRGQLVQEVGTQHSPMVQIALIDMLLACDRAGTQRQLLDLTASPSLDATVRGYLRTRLRQTS
jgi:anti-sigma factor RsiW